MKTTIFNKTSLTLLVLTFISLIFLSSCKENSDTKNTQMNNNSKTNSMQDTMKTTGDNGSSMLDKNSKDMMKKMHAVKLSENIDIDFIYIDGSHVAKDVMSDIVLAWELLKPGGILIADDYLWDHYKEPRLTPKPALDGFLESYKGSYEILLKGYQVHLKKIN